MKLPIQNYENYYIYDNGDVLNSTTSKILSGSIGEHGYKYYRLSKDGVKKMFYAHRLVAEHFIANPENLPVVNHKDGNKLNNNVNNLEWTTYSENTAHWHQTLPKQNYNPIINLSQEQLNLEQWIAVPNFSNYEISNFGRIKNIKTQRILKPVLTCGYLKVRLSENGKAQDWMVHKLVYACFYNDFENIKGYVIDHIDGNKINNSITNLRKITLSENALAALYETGTNKTGKPVAQYNLQGKKLAVFPSARSAARLLHLDSSSIIKNCKGKLKTCGNFIFKYE